MSRARGKEVEGWIFEHHARSERHLLTAAVSTTQASAMASATCSRPPPCSDDQIPPRLVYQERRRAWYIQIAPSTCRRLRHSASRRAPCITGLPAPYIPQRARRVLRRRMPARKTRPYRRPRLPAQEDAAQVLCCAGGRRAWAAGGRCQEDAASPAGAHADRPSRGGGKEGGKGRPKP